MLLLDRQSGATAQPRGEANDTGVSAGRIQLRLRANGQVFELPPGKTTIGSSPRCNVRIEQPGVQPLHCLIVEGPEGLRVRSWVANTTLNGMPFDESPLKVGDCLSLGAIEIEVIDPRAGLSRSAEAKGPTAESNDAEKIRESRNRARSRSRQLLKSLRHERTARQELARQVAKLQESHLDAIAEQNEINVKLQNCLAELADARRQLSDNETIEAARKDLANQNEQLGFEIGELSTQINELTHARAEAATQRKHLADDLVAVGEQQRELIDTNARLQAELSQVAGERAAADEQNRQLTEQKSQLQREFDRLADEKNALAEEHRQLGEINSRLQNDVVRLANEKAPADEQVGQLSQQMLQLQNEVAHLREQKDQLEDEREGLRGQNEQLLSEARQCSVERGSLTDERVALCQERSELRQQNEALRVRIAQLDDENSAMAVGKLTLVEQHDVLNREAKLLQSKVAELSEENATLAAAKAILADERARLADEHKRLAELEREMGAAVAGRENTSAELYHALLQLAELQEQDAQNKAIIETYESLSKEYDQLHDETDQLKEEISRLSEERAAVEGAWKALSDEAVTLSESQQRLADENASLVARWEEAQQQLERAQQEQSTLADSAAEVERERAAKLQAEADIAAAIAEGERRLEEQERRSAEQEEQFAEQSSQFNERSQQQAGAIQLLEQQLAAANESHDSLAKAREETQIQLANANLHRDEQSRCIKELESRLVVAEARAAKAAEVAASQLASRQVESASHVASEPPAEFRWSNARDESSYNGPNLNGQEDAMSRSSLVEPTAGEAVWGRAAGVEDAWSSAPESESATDEPSPWGAKASPQAPVDASTFGEDDDAAEAEPTSAEAVVPARQSSVWNQSTSEPETTFGDSVFAKPEESVQQENKQESGSAAKREPVSFIERYSHLLTEDGAANEETPQRLNELAQVRPAAPVVARQEDPSVASAKNEDEDSIEQYMAKLLQRVRGDSQGNKAASEQPSRMPLNAPTAKPAERPGGTAELLVTTAPESRVEGDVEAVDVQAADSGKLLKRRISSPAPTTNLGALRALANETARLAISRHELRTLRRNAVTKTIVATLAGMTSLWLMLNSPDWRNVQFLTACGALLVAAYWAAEAFRTLLNSMRLAAFEGPEDTALPIDVEEELS
jgi:hypothetical protein